MLNYGYVVENLATSPACSVSYMSDSTPYLRVNKRNTFPNAFNNCLKRKTTGHFYCTGTKQKTLLPINR